MSAPARPDAGLRATASSPLVARGLRAAAIVIALAGVIDPAVTSMRRTRPEVAVVSDAGVEGRALVARVADRLDGLFTVIAAPFGGAAGTVLVGSRLPAPAGELAAPVFAVTPATDRPRVSIDRVDAPARAALEARTAITVTTRATGVPGQRLEISLRSGDLVVDRASVEIASDDARQVTALSHVPVAEGATPLRVTADLAGSSVTAAVDLVVDVREQRWAVLFHDPRPSWQSTFVRRAVERDPRFVVTSRVVTSRGLSIDAGRPPATLGDLAALSSFDAIVIGAPGALGERDVAGLDAYLRRRGGSVVLLLDQRETGPYQRLTSVRDWTGTSSAAGIAVVPAGADSAALRASEVAWPRILPPGARSLAFARVAGADSAAARPVIWESAVGMGRLIVSAALDAWRYRDPAVSSFDVFWQSTIASAADAAIPPVTISLGNATLVPAERGEISVMLRDASLAPITATRGARVRVAASLETPDGRVPIRLWPDGPVGTLRGTFRAPTAAGTYRIIVTGDGHRTDVPLVVAQSVSRPNPDDSDLVTAWAASHGGTAIPVSRLDELAPALERSLRPTIRSETWYPMRSPWWIIPFALMLGAEWLWRRRRGLA